MDEARVAFQLMIAGNTLAGLTLVFLGNVVSGFNSYEPDEQASVRDSYQRQMRFAFLGFLSSLLAALSAFGHNWIQAAWIVKLGVVLLLLAIACVVVAAFNTARGIR